MKKTVFFLVACGLFYQANAFGRDTTTIAVVNFTTCVQESKYGKKEQENFDNLRKQMGSMIEESQTEIQALATKLEDSDYIDSLSPKAEEELKLKFQTKNQDLGRIQNQYYQVLQQANTQVMQKLNENVAKASQSIAKKKNLGIVMNKEACFYYKPTLEVTSLVISEMDKIYETEEHTRKLSENQETKKEAANVSLLDMPLANKEKKTSNKKK